MWNNSGQRGTLELHQFNALIKLLFSLSNRLFQSFSHGFTYRNQLDNCIYFKHSVIHLRVHDLRCLHTFLIPKSFAIRSYFDHVVVWFGISYFIFGHIWFRNTSLKWKLSSFWLFLRQKGHVFAFFFVIRTMLSHVSFVQEHSLLARTG